MAPEHEPYVPPRDTATWPAGATGEDEVDHDTDEQR